MSNGPADNGPLRAESGGCVLVIFGASGDLAHKKLLPAIYNLAEAGHLPDTFAVLGVARPPMTDAQFRAEMRKTVESIEGESIADDHWRFIEERLHYISGEFTDGSLYLQMKDTLQTIRREHGVPPNYLFYLAIPPDLFGTVATRLAHAELLEEGPAEAGHYRQSPAEAGHYRQGPAEAGHYSGQGWRRVIIEKPFGYNLETARTLNAELAASLHESQIFRIDHYLGKETVQNILAFRFANGIFDPIWNRQYVDHVQMTVAEEAGVGTRGSYYDKAGALRDIVQNHMFQLLALIAMEPPISFRAADVQDEKVKVLHAIQPLSADDIRRHVVRGQYDGYRSEPKVAADSRTETYVAMRLLLDNWRWAGVPFYLRTGKSLAKRSTEIAVTFTRPPLTLFRDTPIDTIEPNVLLMRIQPDEGISLSMQAKVPGPKRKLGTVTLDFNYQEYFHAEPVTGYETLLFDAIAGDHTRFHRMDIVEAGWQVVDPVLEAWANDPAPPHTYAPGSWGPAEGDLLLDATDRPWRC